MKKLPLKFETEALNKATMIGGIHDLDCVGCPCFKVKGGRHGVVAHCNHPALCVPIRVRKPFYEVPKWCPRKREMIMMLGISGWE